MNQQTFEEQEIPLADLENIGLGKDGRLLLKDEDLKALLTGSRTQLIRLENLVSGDVRIEAIDAKLSLKRNENGALDLMIHPIYQTPLAPAFLTEDEALALEDGELPNLEKSYVDDHGIFRDVLVEYDKETKEFVITDTERVLVPDFVNSEKLTAEQKERYRKGKEVELQDGTKFQFTGTKPEGIRSNRLALVASIIVDGGLSFMVYHGLKALFGKKHDQEVAKVHSAGYEQAVKDMQLAKHRAGAFTNSR